MANYTGSNARSTGGKVVQSETWGVQISGGRVSQHSISILRTRCVWLILYPDDASSERFQFYPEGVWRFL